MEPIRISVRAIPANDVRRSVPAASRSGGQGLEPDRGGILAVKEIQQRNVMLAARASALSVAASALIFGFGSAHSEDGKSSGFSTQSIHRQFQHPPVAYRPMVRWWWPGGDVQDAELRREIAELDQAGFGGAEIQALFMNLQPNVTEDERTRLYDFGTSRFLQHVRAAVDEARGRGMWIDLTFTSGWPFGGGEVITPERTVTDLLYSEAIVQGGERVHQQLDLPQLSSSPVGSYVHMMLGDPIAPNPPGWDERLKARARTIAVLAFRAQPPQIEAVGTPSLAGSPNIGQSGRIDLSSMVDLTSQMSAAGMLDWQSPVGEWRIFVFRQVAIGDRLMGGAWPGPELILDHLSHEAFDAYAQQLGDPLTTALSDRFGDGLRALFCDNIEIPADLYWSDDFPQEFERRRGYSVVPYLPLIIQFGYAHPYNPATTQPLYDYPEVGTAVRRDYWKTVGELLTERFYQPLVEWGSQHGLLTRLQAHASPTDLLRVYGLAAIPETEQLAGNGTFDFNKVASSAADLYGRKIVSSESFASMGDPYWTTPETLKENTDKLIVAGVNEIVYHGSPYVRDDRPFPGWGPFNTGTPVSFASFMNRRNTFWPYIPRINAYISRLQYVSQIGTAVNPIAVLNTRMGFDNTDIGYDSTRHEDPPITQALQHAGYGFDHINFDALLTGKAEGGDFVTVGGARFRAIVIDDSSWLDSDAAVALASAAQQGVSVIFVGALPTASESFRDYKVESKKVRDAVGTIVTSSRGKHVQTIADLIPTLNASVPPNVRFQRGPALPFIEKKLGPLDAFFFRNPQSDAVTVELEVSASGSPQLWNPWTGSITAYGNFQSLGNAKRISLSLSGHESALLVFDTADQHAAATVSKTNGDTTGIAVSGPWDFHSVGHLSDGSDVRLSRKLSQLIDWAKDEQLASFSGRGTYITHINLPGEMLVKAKHITLDLGDVRDVAEIKINGRNTSALLMPPYASDVSKMIRPGSNEIEITTVNSLSNAADTHLPVIAIEPSMRTAKGYVARPGGLLGPVVIKITK
jgi:hypothetical protein